MEKVVIAVNPRRAAIGFALTFAVLGSAGAFFFYPGWARTQAMNEAQAMLARNLPIHAADALDEQRRRIAVDEPGCQIVLNTYYASRRIDRLRWAIEECMLSNVRSFDVVFAIARVQLLDGQDSTAIRTLSEAAQFNRPESALLLAQLYQKTRNTESMTSTLVQALSKHAANLDLALAALSMLSQAEKWKEALLAADRVRDYLSSESVNDDDLRQAVSRVYARNGDENAARAVLVASRAPKR